jgi:hypothetical protein
MGSLPGVEPRPYILRFEEDKPNPLYRRVCYTFAWNAVLSFAPLNHPFVSVSDRVGYFCFSTIPGFSNLPKHPVNP